MSKIDGILVQQVERLLSEWNKSGEARKEFSSLKVEAVWRLVEAVFPVIDIVGDNMDDFEGRVLKVDNIFITNKSVYVVGEHVDRVDSKDKLYSVIGLIDYASLARGLSEKLARATSGHSKHEKKVSRRIEKICDALQAFDHVLNS